MDKQAPIRFKDITISQPCHENWQKMDASERGRFCQSCQKEVIDFSQKTEAEMNLILQSGTWSGCGRFRANQIAQPSLPMPKVEPAPSFRLPWQKGAAAAFLLLTLWQIPQSSKANSESKHIVCSAALQQSSGPYRLRIGTGKDNYVSGRLVDAAGKKLKDNVKITVTVPDGTVKEIKTKKGRFGIQLRESAAATDTIQVAMAEQVFDHGDSLQVYSEFTGTFTIENRNVVYLTTCCFESITLGLANIPSLDCPPPGSPNISCMTGNVEKVVPPDSTITGTDEGYSQSFGSTPSPPAPVPQDQSTSSFSAILPKRPRWRRGV